MRLLLHRTKRMVPPNSLITGVSLYLPVLCFLVLAHVPCSPIALLQVLRHLVIDISLCRLHGERPLEQRSLDNSSQAYDRNLLSRIGGPNTPNRLSISVHGTDNQAVSPSAESRPEHSRHLSTSSASDRRHPSFDSTHRWPSNVTAPGTMSPGSFRSPGFDLESNRSAVHRHSSFASDGNTSHRSSYDQSMFLGDSFPMDEGQMKDLNINDRSPSISDDYLKAGMKRRASSPHRESARDERSSVSSAPGGSDLYTRRSLQHLPSRNSSVSKYVPNHGSVSSASSYGPRNGSMASSYGLSVASIASSATSYTSGRLSPGAISPAIDPELGNLSYMNAKPLHPSPGPPAGAPSPQPPVHESTRSEPPTHQVDPAQSYQNVLPNGVPNAQGMLMCECCPKKPKKFNTQEELRYVRLELGNLHSFTDQIADLICWRNNIHVHTVQIDSRTKTRLNATKTRCI